MFHLNYWFIISLKNPIRERIINTVITTTTTTTIIIIIIIIIIINYRTRKNH